MVERFSSFLAYIMLIFVAFIIPIFLVGLNMESTVQDFLQNEAVEFVDNARVQGKIRPDTYSELLRDVYRMGNYEISIIHNSKKSYPNYKTNASGEFLDKNGNVTNNVSQMAYSGYTNNYEAHFMNEIADKIYNTSTTVDVPYEMKQGDYLEVKITRKNGGFFSRVKTIMGMDDGPMEVIHYGAEVENNPQ